MAINNPHTLETDQLIEGNTYFGVCVFVGVAGLFLFSNEEVQESVSITAKERDFMEKKFRKICEEYFSTNYPSVTTKRFGTKVNLVLNYLRLVHRKRVSLADIIKEKI